MAIIEIVLVCLLIAALISGRMSPVAAFVGFILAIALLGTMPFPALLGLLAEPALVAVVCLVLFSAVVARMDWLRRLLFVRGQTGLHRIMARFLGLSAAITVSIGFAVFLVLAFSGIVPFALAAMMLIVFAIAGGFLSSRDVKRNFPFELVVILWGSLTLGTVIAQSGLATGVADTNVQVTPGITPALALTLVFLTTWALTEVLSNVSAALVALPIGLEVARLVGAPPEAFVMIVAFGASANFLVPFGYQTHLMVMTPGGYSLADFMRLGLIVLLAYGTTSIIMINHLYLR